MKPIELTEKQKERLIILANYYFKHRTWFFWQSVNEEDGYPKDQMFGHNTTAVVGKSRKYPAVEIHWLEFCIYHLIPKIVKKHSIKYHIDISKLINNEQNIIDNIYVNLYRKYK